MLKSTRDRARPFLGHRPVPASISMSPQSPDLIASPSTWIPSSIDNKHSLGNSMIAHVCSMIDPLDRPRSLRVKLGPYESLLTQIENPSLIERYRAGRASKEYQIRFGEVQSVAVSTTRFRSLGRNLLPSDDSILKLSKVERLWGEIASHIGPSK